MDQVYYKWHIPCMSHPQYSTSPPYIWFWANCLHLQVPMISCFNRQVRMNEVYIENETLQFNCTPFIDFNTFERPKLDLYARWALSNPIGETSKYPKIKPTGPLLTGYLEERNHRKKNKSKSLPKTSEMPVSRRVRELRGNWSDLREQFSVYYRL